MQFEFLRYLEDYVCVCVGGLKYGALFHPTGWYLDG